MYYSGVRWPHVKESLTIPTWGFVFLLHQEVWLALVSESAVAGPVSLRFSWPLPRGYKTVSPAPAITSIFRGGSRKDNCSCTGLRLPRKLTLSQKTLPCPTGFHLDLIGQNGLHGHSCLQRKLGRQGKIVMISVNQSGSPTRSQTHTCSGHSWDAVSRDAGGDEHG